MVGTNGVPAANTLTALQRCPESPNKRKYLTLDEATKAGIRQSRETKLHIQPYACPACGYFHLSRSTYSDRVIPTDDGTILTTGLQRRELYPIKSIPERVDMSEVLAMESPIVGVNKEARERLVAQLVADRESITVSEVQEHLGGVSPYIAHTALRGLGWEGLKGRADWYPPGKAPALGKRAKGAKSSKSSASALRASRLRKLKGYLVERPEVATTEVMELLDCGKDMAKALLHESGWRPGFGNGARWTKPGAEPERIKKPVTLHAVEQPLEDPTPIQEAMERHPANREQAAPVVLPITEIGWRPVPDLAALSEKQVRTIIAELAVYGLEMRIEIREKR